MQIDIKNATTKNLDAINTLLRASKAYWGYDEKFMNLFMQKLGISKSYLLKNKIKLLYLNGDITGFYNFILNNDGDLELDNFFLHPQYIGKGLGKKLWDACCQTAREYKKNEFIIWSDPNAEPFYNRMGCKKIGGRSSPIMPNRCPSVLKYIL